MDTLTHGLLGAAVARSLPARLAPGAPAARIAWMGALAAVFPDIDNLSFWIDPLRYLADWHRGPTHSLLLLPAWAALLAVTLGRLLGIPPWTAMALAAAALLSHLAADLITAYGVALLYPLSDWRPGLATSFVVDAVFTGLLAGGLLAARRWGRTALRVSLLGLGVYLGLQGLLKLQATTVLQEQSAAAGRPVFQARALPMPPAPLFWKLLAEDGDGPWEAHLTLHPPLQGLLRTIPPLRPLVEPYRAAGELQWRHHAHPDSAGTLVAGAWRQPRLEAFRRFAQFPALLAHRREGTGECVWFTDRRYALPGLRPSFRYGVCRSSPAAPWRAYRLPVAGPDRKRAL